MEADALVTQMSWHLVGSSVWMPLLTSLAPNKTRNPNKTRSMAGFQLVCCSAQGDSAVLLSLHVAASSHLVLWWYQGTYGMFLSLSSWYWLIRVILCKGLLNGKQLLFLSKDVTVSYFLFSWQNICC